MMAYAYRWSIMQYLLRVGVMVRGRGRGRGRVRVRVRAVDGQ